MKKILPSLILLSTLLLSTSYALAQIAIGQWRDHLSFKRALDVCEADEKIYCAGGSNLFSYNKIDGSIERYSKINLLSDIGVTKLAYDKKRKVLIVVYANANIDLIKDGKVFNLADIKRKSILGSKSINNILINDNYTYLSCGFGIVVLDLDKYEIKDTYYLANNNPSVNECIVTSDKIYAATSTGMYFALKSTSNLGNPANWKLEPGLTGGNYNTLTVYKDSLLVNKPSGSGGKIYIRSLDGSPWTEFQSGASTLRLKTYGENLYIVYAYGVSVRDAARNQVNFLGGGYGYPPCSPPKVCYQQPLNVIVDANGITWLVDAVYGLVEYPAPFTYVYLSPSGPFTNNVYSLSFTDAALWVAPGGHDDAWTNLYNQEGVSGFSEEEWVHKEGDGIFDIFKVKQDPLNENRIFATAWFQGLAQYNSTLDTAIVVYNNTNSTIKQWNLNPGFYGVSGLDFDSQGNLWIANAYTSTLINVLKTDGKWRAFNTAVVPELNGALTGAIIATQSNQKWVLLPRQGGGILVFDDNGTLDDLTDDKVKIELHCREWRYGWFRGICNCRR